MVGPAVPGEQDELVVAHSRQVLDGGSRRGEGFASHVQGPQPNHWAIYLSLALVGFGASLGAAIDNFIGVEWKGFGVAVGFVAGLVAGVLVFRTAQREAEAEWRTEIQRRDELATKPELMQREIERLTAELKSERELREALENIVNDS